VFSITSDQHYAEIYNNDTSASFQQRRKESHNETTTDRLMRGKFPLLNAVKRLWSDRSGFSLMHEAQRLISKNRRCATHVGSSEKHARSEEHPASVDR